MDHKKELLRSLWVGCKDQGAGCRVQLALGFRSKLPG